MKLPKCDYYKLKIILQKKALIVLGLTLMIISCSENGEDKISIPTWKKEFHDYTAARFSFNLKNGTNLVLFGSHLMNIDNNGQILSDITPFHDIEVEDIKLLPSNEIIITGREVKNPNDYTNHYAVMAKYSLDGTELWRNYPTDKSTPTSGYAVNHTSENEYVVAATSLTDIGDPWKIDINTIDKNGQVIRSNQFDAPQNTETHFRTMWITSDGKIILLASTNDLQVEYKLRLYMMEMNGSIIWEKQYGPHGLEKITSLYEEEDGYIFVGDRFTDGWAFRINKNGQEDWNKIYDYKEIYKCGLYGITPSINNNGYALIGYRFDPDKANDFWLIDTDSKGNMNWEQFYGDSTERQWGFSILKTTDQRYLLGGWNTRFDGTSHLDGLLYKVNADGTFEDLP